MAIVQRFVRNGSMAGSAINFGAQQQMENGVQGCASRTTCDHHEKFRILLNSQTEIGWHGKESLMSVREGCCAAPSVATHQRSEVDQVQPSNVRECCSTSEVELPSAVLEKIKEGMAQLLAEYTWPWYEQNVHLFRSLYNVHLINDVAFPHDVDIRRT